MKNNMKFFSKFLVASTLLFAAIPGRDLRPLVLSINGTQSTKITYNNINEDGSVLFDGSNYSRHEDGIRIDIGPKKGIDINRGYIEFDTSAIPDSAVIKEVKLNLTTTYNFYQGEVVDIKACKPISKYSDTEQGNEDYYTHIGESKRIYAKDTTALSTRGFTEIYLNKNAAKDLRDQLKKDVFTLCMMETDETGDEAAMIYSSEYASEVESPSITVSYIDYSIDAIKE